MCGFPSRRLSRKTVVPEKLDFLGLKTFAALQPSRGFSRVQCWVFPPLNEAPGAWDVSHLSAIIRQEQGPRGDPRKGGFFGPAEGDFFLQNHHLT